MNTTPIFEGAVCIRLNRRPCCFDTKLVSISDSHMQHYLRASNSEWWNTNRFIFWLLLYLFVCVRNSIKNDKMLWGAWISRCLLWWGWQPSWATVRCFFIEEVHGFGSKLIRDRIQCQQKMLYSNLLAWEQTCALKKWGFYITFRQTFLSFDSPRNSSLNFQSEN